MKWKFQDEKVQSAITPKTGILQVEDLFYYTQYRASQLQFFVKVILLQLMDFVALQRHIFSNALQYVKPKTGKIVYITCSILDEENVQQVSSSARKHDPSGDQTVTRAPGNEVSAVLTVMHMQAKFFCQQHGLVLAEPPFHSLPTSHGMDGFFCATFSRQDP